MTHRHRRCFRQISPVFRQRQIFTNDNLIVKACFIFNYSAIHDHLRLLLQTDDDFTHLDAFASDKRPEIGLVD